MKMKLLLIAMVLHFPFTSAAIAMDTMPFNGTYVLTSKDFSDPPSDEKKDRVHFYFSGQAAKDIYEAMPGPAVKDECNSDELVTVKTAGGLRCLRYPNDYYCGVGIKLKSGSTTNAFSC